MKRIVLALAIVGIVGSLVACGDKTVTVMYNDGVVGQITDRHGLELNKGDTIVVRQFPETGNSYVYGYYTGVVPDVFEVGGRPRIMYQKAVVIKP